MKKVAIVVILAVAGAFAGMACGGGGFGPEHSQSTEAYLMHTPGLRVCLPSTDDIVATVRELMR